MDQRGGQQAELFGLPLMMVVLIRPMASVSSVPSGVAADRDQAANDVAAALGELPG
jgi:hypothetical protein